MAPNQTKFNPPLPSPAAVTRDHLLETLERKADVHLVLLLAPAGYGKTTLMTQWIQRIVKDGGYASWLTLDDSDNDAARFMCYLYAALRNWMLEALGPTEVDAGAADWMSLLDKIGPNAPAHTLFLDEFEKITAEPALRVAKLLADRLPRMVRLVISSRDKPAIGLERYRVRGELFELTAGDLRFDTDETRRFLSGRMSEPLAAWLIEKMQGITGGWPAALQLTALAARSQKDLERYACDLSGSLTYIADYLAEDVLHAQPLEVRAFLLETCGFPRLSAAVCNAATGRTDSQRILHYLERHGLFTAPIDASHTWYRYHPLFAEFLLTQQARELSHAQVVATHRGAARWFARHGTAVEAVNLWLLAGDNEAAIRQIASCAQQLVMQAQFGTILRWIDRLDEHALAEAGPELSLAAVWAYGFSGVPEDAMTWLARTKSLLESNPTDWLRDELAVLETVLTALCGDTKAALKSGLAHWPQIDRGRRFAVGALANAISYCMLSTADFTRARRFCNEARLCNEEVSSALGLGYALAISGMIEATQGNLDQALEQFGKVDTVAMTQLRQQPWFDPTHINVASAGLIASVLYEKDRLDEAKELLQRYHPLVMPQPSVDMLLLSRIVYARIKVAQGDVEGAFELLRRGHLTVATGCLSARIRRILEWERFRIDFNLNGGERALAHMALADQEDASDDQHDSYWVVEELCGCGIENIRCAIARNKPAKALERLDTEITLAHEKGRRWRLLKLLLLSVIASDAQGNRDAAHTTLLRAVSLGWRIGARRSFTDEGNRIQSLLAELPPQAVVRLADGDAIMRYWHDLCGERPPLSASPAASNATTLSERERAIIKLLASGMGNEAIAEVVFLSVNTVKWHIRRILEKLDARNRSEAVFIARQRGLIDV